MELSNRLKAVADLVSPGTVVCDVGCDHGYVPIYLVQNQICAKVIAMDVNAGPLERAREHIRAFALEEYIETRRSDGVEALEWGEADCLILAGMGGRLVMRILAEGREKVQAMREVILQPQSDIGQVRAFLRRSGFGISQENMVYEDGKYYPMIRAEWKTSVPVCMDGETTESVRQQAYDRYGPKLLQKRHKILYQYLLWEQERETAIGRRILTQAGNGSAANDRRLAELSRSAQVRDFALSCFEQK